MIIIIYHDEMDTTTRDVLIDATTTATTMPLSHYAQSLPPIELPPRTSWQKDAFGKISEYLMRGIHQHRLSLLNCFEVAARILLNHFRPRRKFNIGTRYRLCSTRVI